MYVCMCMYVCVCESVRVWVSECVCVCVCVRVWIYSSTQLCMYVYVRTFLRPSSNNTEEDHSIPLTNVRTHTYSDSSTVCVCACVSLHCANTNKLQKAVKYGYPTDLPCALRKCLLQISLWACNGSTACSLLERGSVPLLFSETQLIGVSRHSGATGLLEGWLLRNGLGRSSRERERCFLLELIGSIPPLVYSSRYTNV